MRDYLKDISWSIDGDDLEMQWGNMKDTLLEVTDKFIPKQFPKKKKNKIWSNRTVIQAVKMKHRAWNRYSKTRSTDSWETYCKARNFATSQVKKAKIEYERKIARQIKQNSKCFWKMVRDKTKVKEGIPDLMSKKGEIIKDDKGKAEILNSFFASVFTKEDKQNIPEMQDRPFRDLLEDIDINMTRVRKILQELKQNKSPGPDGIHNRVLYEIRDEIAQPLTNLFRCSLDTGELPSEWKIANITPIYKKGRKADPNNYRPVSLTSAVCKMMERLVRDELENHLEKLGLLSPSQHGFRKGRSCCTQLLEVIHDWADILEESKPIDVIYLDYRKAFDSVPYERLLVKLHAHGIRGKVLQWIRNFLKDREQRVVINGVSSNAAFVTSGIPQGSVLGPILFLIYVNDLPEIVTSTVKLFADDTKIYRKIQNTHDSEELQRDLDKLMNWSQRWQLPFNMGKCSILHLGKNNPNHKYKLTSEGDIVELVEIEEEKDLGIKFDSLLSFKQHTSECVSKANQRIGLIRRNFQQLDNYMFLLLYKSLIRPLLEYGNTVWYPCYKQDSQELEKVQRRATKLVKNLRDMAYPARLRALDLPTLVYRRKRADMLQMYRIITGVDNLDRL